MEIWQRNKALTLLFFPALLTVASLLFLGMPLKFLLIILGILLFVISFANTNLALIILIFSMLLSPEFKLGTVPGRDVVVRIDDILLFVVFFGWLAKMAVNKELGLLRTTPLNALIIAYIATCIISTAIGIIAGPVTLSKSFFYILKYLQYFMLYFLVTNNIADKGQTKIFITAFLITGFIICIYASTQIGAGFRVTAPFEGPHPEPNTLGGYLILLFAVSMGIFLYSPSLPWQILSGILAFLTIPPLIFTLSRGSYVAFIPMYLTLILLSRKKKVFLIAALILAIFIVPVVLPRAREAVTKRIEATFTSTIVYKAFGKRIPLEQSAASRIESWKRVFRQWTKRPLFGHGVTGVGLVDAQYPRVLGETGIIGFSIFIWLIITIFKHSLKIFSNIDDDWAKGLALGFLAGFIGLVIQSFVANTFIIVRIMEPFWFLAAIVMMLPQISISSETPHS
ncbi:MAG: O-antigen ligase family protein [Candidatus Omnitrophota bacterium]|nr:MAG: O-antigen ligase family protein [Candidatus Omnitrophota bacterium]